MKCGNYLARAAHENVRARAEEKARMPRESTLSIFLHHGLLKYNQSIRIHLNLLALSHHLLPLHVMARGSREIAKIFRREPSNEETNEMKLLTLMNGEIYLKYMKAKMAASPHQRK